MVSDDEPGFDYLGRSHSCACGTHKNCGHVGGGFRTPMRGRLQSTIVLCRCVCHANCPVTGWRHVPLTAWQTLCECPGEMPQRAWKEDIEDPWPGAREQWEREDAAGRSRRRAFESARQAAAGKTREQARQIYVDELRARGQEMPSELPSELLEARVDMLVGRPLRALARLWRAITRPGSSEHL